MKCEYESPSEISLCTWPCHAMADPARPGQTRPEQAWQYMHTFVYVCMYYTIATAPANY